MKTNILSLKSGLLEKSKMQYAEFLLLFWLSELYLMTGARFVLHHIGFSEGPLRETVLFFVASMPLLLLLCTLKKFDRRQYLPGLFLIGAVIIALVLTVIFNPIIKTFLMRPGYGLERLLRPECAVFAFLFFGLVEDPDALLDAVKKYAYMDLILIIVINLIPRLINGYFEDVDGFGNMVKRPYSLSFGYAMLLPTIIFLYLFIREKKPLHLLLGLFGGATIFLYGNRGALLMIGIFAGLMIISNIVDTEDRNKRKKKILWLCGLGVAFLLLGLPLLQGTALLLGKLGIESRTLRMIANGTITSGTGRGDIWRNVIVGIKEGGLLGHGIYGDRPYAVPIHYAGYSHNIFLEMIASFGLLGVALIIKMAADTIRMIFFCKDTRWRGLFIIFFSVSCQLLLSMSFWYVMEFWAAAAIANRCFAIQRKEKRLAAANDPGRAIQKNAQRQNEV